MKRILVLLFSLTLLLSFSNVHAQNPSGDSGVVTTNGTLTFTSDSAHIGDTAKKAQVAKADSTTTVTSTAPSSSNWLADNWGKVVLIILGLYEILARLYPTVTNISILSLIMKFLGAIVPNNKENVPGAPDGGTPTKHESIS